MAVDIEIEDIVDDDMAAEAADTIPLEPPVGIMGVMVPDTTVMRAEEAPIDIDSDASMADADETALSDEIRSPAGRKTSTHAWLTAAPPRSHFAPVPGSGNSVRRPLSTMGTYG